MCDRVYSWNYSKTTGSLWFYSKDETTTFHADITNDDNSKSLKNAVANRANGILRNATIAVSLKYLRNFWRSLEMPLINFKVELKVEWAKYCALPAVGADNANANPDYIIFSIKDPKLYLSLVTLSAWNNQNLSKLPSKGFDRSFYWNKYKAKSENKNRTNKYIYIFFRIKIFWSQ